MDPRSSPDARAPLRRGTIRFAACELRIGSRELLFCRQVSPIGPKAFDVLLYLIDHHERVVSKDELLNAIWRTPYVSGSVVARIIMKLRRAIGDTTVSPQIIRTVHRVGYRFVAALEAPAEQPLVPYRTSERPASRPRIALLPFRNGTGIPELAWVEWGLPSVVAQVLSSDGTIVLVPLRDSILALGALCENAPLSACAIAVLRATSADFSLGATVSGTIGRFRVDWSLFGASGECVADHLGGVHLPALATALALSAREWLSGALEWPSDGRTLHGDVPGGYLAG